MCFYGQWNLRLVRAWECWEEGSWGPYEHFKGGSALSWEGMLVMLNFYWLMRSPRCDQAIKWQMQFFVGKYGAMYVRTERSLGPYVMYTIVGSALADQCHAPMSCCNYNCWFCGNISFMLSGCWGKGALGITRKEAQTTCIGPWPTCTLHVLCRSGPSHCFTKDMVLLRKGPKEVIRGELISAQVTSLLEKEVGRERW